MGFRPGPWFDMEISPVHAGLYEVQLKSGATGRVAFWRRAWEGDAAQYIAWRGRELVGTSKAESRPHRVNLEAYHSAVPSTHSAALESALFLARRAVSLNYKSDAYRFYLIANAIDRTRLKRYDKKWVERYARNRDVGKVQLLVDRFFNESGGRPRLDMLEEKAEG